jgi:hypothetical protein
MLDFIVPHIALHLTEEVSSLHKWIHRLGYGTSYAAHLSSWFWRTLGSLLKPPSRRDPFLWEATVVTGCYVLSQYLLQWPFPPSQSLPIWTLHWGNECGTSHCNSRDPVQPRFLFWGSGLCWLRGLANLSYSPDRSIVIEVKTTFL